MLRQFVSQFKKNQLKSLTWAMTEDGAVQFKSLSDATLEGALNLIRKSCFISENLCVAVSLLEEPGAPDELMKSCIDAAKDGVSVVAIDTNTNKVVGVNLNKIQVSAPKGEGYYEKLSQSCKHKASKAIFDFVIEVDNKADLFNHYNSDCLLELMYVVTVPGFKQRNIAKLMLSSTMELGKQLYHGKDVKTPIGGEIINADYIPSLVTALASSNYSQNLLKGFDNILEINYDDFTFNGRKFSEKIGNTHKTCRLVAKRLY